MRNYSLNIRLSAVMVAPLLLACGSNSTGGGGTYVMVPACGGASGQVLTTDSTGQLVCQPLPAGAVSLPACTANTDALTADGTNLSCTPLNTVDSTTQMYLNTLTMIEQQIQNAGTSITKIGAGPAAQPIYVGPSTMSVTGRITYNTSTPGVSAAAAICAAQYGAGAHMCTVYEMYYSVALLKNVNATTAIGQSWVYLQSFKTGSSTAVGAPLDQTNPVFVSGNSSQLTQTAPNPYAGLSDNCGGYTSATPGGHLTNTWDGTTFNYVLGYNNVLTPRFDATVSCAASLPIACCQ